MNIKEYNEFIAHVENEVPVDKWKYKDIDFWPIVRCGIKPQDLQDKSKVNRKVRNVLDKILRLSFSLLYTLRSLPQKLKPSDVLFISTSVNYRFKLDNKPVDYYLYPIEKELNLHKIKSFKWGIYAESSFRLLPYTLYVDDFVRYLHYIFNSSKEEIFQLPGQEKFNSICNQFNYTPDMSLYKKRAVAEYNFAKTFEKRLKKIKPRTVLISCYSGKWGIIYACKKNNIKTVDVQHGVQGVLHYEYNYWKHKHNILPDIFWCWREEDKKQIQNWGGNVYLGGHPFFRAINQNIIKLSSRNDLKNGILISLQKGFDWSFIKEILKFTDNFFYIRFHPATEKSEKDDIIKYLNSLKVKNFNLNEANNIPLPLLLNSINFHITLTSSVVIECALAGIKSLCLDNKSNIIYKKLVQDHMVYISKNTEDIRIHLNEAKDHIIGEAKYEPIKNLIKQV